MGFLCTGFVAYKQGEVTYATQTFLQIFPFMFSALCIITLQKYKTTIYFGFKK